ncbi:MAG: 30S ribosomal protein S4 [Candidatus Helarchaeota archaeon]|nr:30S ribosomal protein S4 [Candidatus Helarchaeota archaeon]
MGDPKKHRKKYSKPRNKWQKERLEKELNLLGKYGLRNKKEIWRLQSMVSKYRGRARKLLSLTEEERDLVMKELNSRLNKIGLLPETANVEDILRLTIEDILERRLQTMVFNLGLAVTIYHSRQLITHGHIAIAGQKVTSPGHLVKRREEKSINYSSNSPYSNPDHPMRNV